MRERFQDMLTNKDNDYRHAVPTDSYSRELDSRVQASEMPYGYEYGEPSAGSENHGQRERESNKQYRPRK